MYGYQALRHFPTPYFCAVYLTYLLEHPVCNWGKGTNETMEVCKMGKRFAVFFSLTNFNVNKQSIMPFSFIVSENTAYTWPRWLHQSKICHFNKYCPLTSSLYWTPGRAHISTFSLCSRVTNRCKWKPRFKQTGRINSVWLAKICTSLKAKHNYFSWWWLNFSYELAQNEVNYISKDISLISVNDESTAEG